MSAAKLEALIRADGVTDEWAALCRLHALRRVVLDQLAESLERDVAAHVRYLEGALTVQQLQEVTS